ncbi:fimbria/pilus outer membrane usher protein [Moellerella wisconsensis]|uniref:Fimbria/pilus outer membrane usher protein n=2 Tax=Moellerella wisconsensis TaxID=158849 RepID=A0A9Q8V358_9GAMM|nr:fimbria/pilus outer membrane usher protein [Moellerella wisconsensis]UNH26608.1 fimbria/pilus outer membrane usher protein [Moellerella wisconsensis]UNH30019.1 fimbria/pilus outer membrane usher protein [Moellerella wisconsensis]UNH38244.1 fimbria/pilus outer membrane usher protein [Moellerella wisconsensis]UNH41754.1 fimbria/pilus outer membrane usher protein [Moellerella wisconsensis]
MMLSIKEKITVFMVSMLCLSKTSYSVEFNTDILNSEDKANIDVSRFKNPNFILPGTYFFNIIINNTQLTQSTVPIQIIGDSKDASVSDVCIDKSYINSLGIKEKYIDELTYWNNGQCIDFSVLKGVSVIPNLPEGIVTLNIPQLYLEYMDNNWLPKSLWDEGINGLLLDYNANYQYSDQDSLKHQIASISGYIGANLGAWRLRSEYYGNYQKQVSNGQTSTIRSFLFNAIYLYRNIKELNSKLVIGESTTPSQILEPIKFTGLSLFTNDSMLPPRLRGYAPEITGIAKTNARVVITQLGRVLYDGNVPAGPFKIQSLNSGTRGELNVKIIEQDGSEQQFIVNSSNVPYLTRPGTTRYNVSAGQPTKVDHSVYRGVFFFRAEASHGLNNNWSLNGATDISQGYQQISLGIGRFMNQFGALSVNIARSFTQLDHNSPSGNSYSVNYSKTFDDYDMDLTFAGYRFTDRKYYTLSQYLNLRDDRTVDNEKERYQITLSKRLGEFNINLNYQLQQYWDKGQTHQYGLNIGKSVNIPYLNLQGGSVTLSANRNYYQNKYDDQISLMLSVPFGKQFYTFDTMKYNDTYNSRVSVSNLTDDNDYYNLSASTSYGKDAKKQSTLAGMYDLPTRYASINSNMSISDKGDNSLGFGLNGGVTLTQYGVALHSSSYSSASRLMIDTNNIADVPLNNGTTVTNRLGIGVIPNMTNYYKNSYNVDLSKLPDNIESSNTVYDIALTEGAIGYRKISADKGFKLFANIKMSDNSGSPPFGSQVLNEKGREVGIVSDNGLVWLTAVQSEEKLNINWSNKTQCSTTLPILDNATQIILICEK